MTLIDLGAPAAASEPVALAAFKRFARIERDDEDAEIAFLIRAARETVEARTGLVLLPRTFRLSVDPVPSHGWIECPRRPVTGIEAVTAYGVGGVPREFGPQDAIVERALGLEAVRLAPAVRVVAIGGVEVEFAAGLAPDAIPADLIHAVKLIAAAAYECRGAVAREGQPALMPPFAAALIAAHAPKRI